LILGVRVVHDKASPSALRPRLAILTLALAAASAAEMALLYRPSFDPSRVYFGTDTRAFELLVGAALAMVWPSWRLRADIAGRARTLLEWVGGAGLLTIGVLIWRTNEYSPFLYRGGFVLLSVASACTIAVLVHPACRLGAILGATPLRWVGVRSYGIYLWSTPIIALTTPAAAHSTDLTRALLQVTATMCVAAVSWRFIEQPLRHGALGRLWGQFRSAGWQLRSVPPRAWATATLALFTAVTAGVALTLWNPAREATAAASGQPGGRSASVSRSFTARSGAVDTTGQSVCRSVIHIGDSTSEGLVSPSYLPDPGQRIEAQYAHVGATIQHFEISGARSIVETYEGQPNAYEVAQRWKRAGYRGCWVLALGTNDAADVYVGSSVDPLARVQRMMSLIGEEPVMWVNVKSLLSSGPYAEQNMREWNKALLQACSAYPNMRVFNWAALAKKTWFIDDGIHYTTPGYAARSHLIAQALALAFPAVGASAGCIVN
jgi:hypothetical protein